jgi:signal transduction histidine kinase/ActR/RegA family two-component response regulator
MRSTGIEIHDRFLAYLSRKGEIGAQILKNKDTILGGVANWPNSLKAIVQLLLDSQFPMFVAWGPELAFLYNEPYTAFLDAKHPAVIGKPFREVWSEIWSEVGPLAEKALNGDTSYFEDLPLVIHRNGRAEQTSFTFSYSPVQDDAGQIAGMYCAVMETTTRVLAERRQAFQLRLADSLRTIIDPVDIMQTASGLIGDYLGVARVGYGEVDYDRGKVIVHREWTAEKSNRFSGTAWPLELIGSESIEVLRRGATLCLDDIQTDSRTAPYVDSYANLGTRSMVMVPLLMDGQWTAAFYLHDPDRRNWTREEVTLVEDVARRTWDAVLRARAEEVQREESRILDILNKTGQALVSTLNLDDLLQQITDAGTQLTGAQFGAFFYNSIDANGKAYMLYALSGAPREAFEKFGCPRATPVFSPTFHGEGVIRSNDITQDPRYGKMGPHHGMPKGHLPVRSYLAASVISRSGEVIGGLFFGHADVGIFTAKDERIIEGVAAQAAIAVDNARLYDQAQKAAQERQELLASERAARAEAERLIRAKDEFLAMLAHELRNPLAPVSAAAQILNLAGHDETRVRQVSEIISRQVGHLTHLIDDLMDVSRVTRGLIQLEKESVDIKSVVASAVEQVRPLIEERQHALNIRMDADHAVVHGDRTRLVQVVTNLLNNAAKYTQPRGEISLYVGLQGMQVLIRISDNGNGIDASLLPYVFDLFTQGTRHLDRSQGGLGIGLALVKAVVGLHAGQITASSDGLGQGSTFTVFLPQATPDTALTTVEAPVATDASALSILVVDDNYDAAHSLAVLLQALGHHVTVKTSAATALEVACEHYYDAFILDIGLPDITGYDLARQLHTQTKHRHAIFIALTGYSQPQDREHSQAAGFHYHLVKPANIQALSNALVQARRTSLV